MTIPEAQVVFDILNAWGAHPRVRLSRQNIGKAYPPGADQLVTYGVPGTGDIVGLVAPSGRMIHLECKRLNGKRRKSQLTMQRVIRAFGGIYEFTESLAEADAVFAALGITR